MRLLVARCWLFVAEAWRGQGKGGSGWNGCPVRVLGCWVLGCWVVLAAPAWADDWGTVATISGTMGVQDGRICVGEASRGDIGCPAYTPYVSATSGFVGIGIDSPIAPLHISSTSDGKEPYLVLSNGVQSRSVYLSQNGLTLQGTSSNGNPFNALTMTVNGSFPVTGTAYGLVATGLVSETASAQSAIGALGRGYMQSSGNVTNLMGVQGDIYLYGAGATGQVQNAYALYAGPLTLGGGATATVSQSYGLYIRPRGVGATRYGIYQIGPDANYFGGNVGIGTLSPSVALEVGGTVSATRFVGDGSGLTGIASSGDRIVSGTSSVVANNNGSIVATTPSGSLHVGDSVNTSVFASATTINTTFSGLLGYENQITTSNGTYYGIGSGGRAYAYVDSGVTNNGYIMGLDGSGFNVSAGNINSTYGVRAGTGNYTSNSTGTITNAYGVYVQSVRSAGTITNGYGVYIGDGLADNQYGIYQQGSDDANYFAGKVGIGTTTPYRTLDVVSSLPNMGTATFGSSVANGYPGFSLRDNNGKDQAGITWSNSGAGFLASTFSMGTNASSPMIFYTSGTEAMRIDGARNVGIGTATPTAVLDVSGTLKIGGTVADSCGPGKYGTMKIVNGRIWMCREN